MNDMKHEKKKILIVIRKLGIGGAEKVLINIANNLNQEKFSTTICFVEDGGYRSLVKEHVKLVQLKSKSTILLPFEIKKILSREKYDVLLYSWPKLAAYIYIFKVLKHARVKTIFRVPISLKSQLEKSKFFNNFIVKFLLSKAINSSDSVIVLCNEMRRELEEEFHIDSKKITVIYNPVDQDFIQKQSRKFNPFENNDGINLVSAGRLEYQKGFDLLLRAFAIVVYKIPNIKLTILGSGSKANELKQLASDLNINSKVDFVDWVENPYPYFKNADAFVLPSRFEGFPNVLIEALACGTKIVSTDCSTGPKEIIGENEEYGWIAKSEDYISLAEKIIEALNSQKKSTEEALRRFLLKDIAKQYESIIDDVLKIKLLMVISELDFGGAQRVFVTLSNYFSRKGTKVTLVAFRDGSYKNDLSDQIFSLIILNASRARKAIFKLLKVIRAFKPDLIFTTLVQDSFVIAVLKVARLINVKHIVRFPNQPEKLFPKTIHKLIAKFIISSADMIVTQTKSSENKVRELFRVSVNKTKTIYNPIDIELVKNKSLEFNPFLYLTDKIKIVTAGRLTKQKGFDILLKAFKEIKDKFPNAILFILGDGEQKENLRILANQLGIDRSVNFVGWVDNPYPYYRYCDVFVMASRYEGMPNTLIEALVCDAKIVSTNCPTGPVEIVGEDEQCGWLAPVDSYNELAKKIEAAILSKKEVSKECYEKFSGETISNIYIDMFKKLLKGIKVEGKSLSEN